jgi:TolA-binding protein
MYGYGDRLIREKKLPQARELFERLTREHPKAWVNWYGLARVQVALGNREAARRTLEASQPYATTRQQQGALKRLLERLAAGQDIGGRP